MTAIRQQSKAPWNNNQHWEMQSAVGPTDQKFLFCNSCKYLQPPQSLGPELHQPVEGLSALLPLSLCGALKGETPSEASVWSNGTKLIKKGGQVMEIGFKSLAKFLSTDKETNLANEAWQSIPERLHAYSSLSPACSARSAPPPQRAAANGESLERLTTAHFLLI